MTLTMHYLLTYPSEQFDVIKQLLGNVHSHNSTLRYIAERRSAEHITKATDSEMQLSLAEDQATYEEFLNEVDQASYQLVVVSLNSLIEITLKKVAGVPANTRHYADELKKSLRSDGINFKEIDGHGDYEEIRLVANCIKHSGSQVSDDLHKFNSSKFPSVEARVLFTVESIDRYYEGAKRFLHHMCSQAPRA